MTDKFVVKGNKELNGEIEVLGSKNAAGPTLASVLLTDEECIVDNLPLIEDIKNTIEILESLGAKIEWMGERKIKIKADSINVKNMDFGRFSKTRMSVLFIGSLISRFNNFEFPSPGGDKIGLRPINVHIKALEKLGATIKKNGDIYEVEKNELVGREIVLQEFSVTATEVIMMASVLARGKTVIKGGAAEPHVEDLGNLLLKMGAKIEGHGTHTIEIEGVEKLHGFEHSIIPDYLEAGTFIIVGATTPGTVTVKNVNFNHLDIFLAKLEDMGIKFERGENKVIVHYSPDLSALKIQALPHPGFPTDLLPIITTILTRAKGKSLIHDPLYENRLAYVQELRKMGADIEIVDPHRAFVFGPKELVGLNIDSSDIRAGMSLIVAALMADGVTTINNIYQIDRGYEKIEERLKKLGADIKRVTE